MTNKEIIEAIEAKQIDTEDGPISLDRFISVALRGKNGIPTREEAILGLNKKVMFVALNASKPLEHSYENYHGGSRYDQRIFHLLGEEEYESLVGGYMTDFGKGITEDFIEADSKKFKDSIEKNPEYERRCAAILRFELSLLSGKDTVIICFGGDTMKLLKKNGFNKENGYKIFQCCHYSWRYIKDEDYYKKTMPIWDEAVKALLEGTKEK